MKAMTFSKGLEIRLDVEGEESRQGDSIDSKLSIKNRQSSAATISAAFVELATGDLKKVKAKTDDAFSVHLRSLGLQEVSICPGETRSFDARFNLDLDCPITDGAQSLFLRYGLSEAGDAGGILQLSVSPHSDIDGILQVLETSFQFVPKKLKSQKGWVVSYLKPPSGQEFRLVDELELSLRRTGEGVELGYVFKVKGFEAGPNSLSIKKKKLKFDQSLERSQYFSTSGFVDAKLLEPFVVEALKTVETGLVV